ncbi:AMP-binding protein [Streptomyces sp. NPDC005373]|uniref:AMP-binding protein n=1 Tax=Streptomyces sp. NPDC005373 TaxID=3156879 RepID=UPI0033BCC725
MRPDLKYLSIPNAVRHAAARFDDATAILDDGASWSYRDLEHQMLQAVRAALALGIRHGDRVGICAHNSAEWIVAALGTQGAGGIAVPLSAHRPPAELAYALRKSGATALITSSAGEPDLIAELRSLDPALPALGTTVAVPGRQGGADLSWSDFLAYGAAVPEGTAHASIDRMAPDDVSEVMFTGGTCGRLKGAVLTHGQSLRAYGWMAQDCSLRDSDTVLAIRPFSDSFGCKAGWLAPFLHGARVVPLPWFDAVRALELIERSAVSVVIASPTNFQNLIDVPSRSRYDTSSLRVSMTGGATISEELLRAMKDDLSFDTVVNAFGPAESTGLATTTRINDSPELVAHTVGRAIPDAEVRIVDGGSAVPDGDPGEIHIRGYHVTRGYWEEPGATAAAIDVNGWLHTGDTGALDADGHLSLVERGPSPADAGHATRPLREGSVSQRS